MVHKYAVLSVTTLGALMAAIDSTIIFLAIPEIGQYFGIGDQSGTANWQNLF